MMHYAIKYTPVDKGTPGLLCNHAGDVVLFANSLPSSIYKAAEKALPGVVLGIYLYADGYPNKETLIIPVHPLQSVMNYA